MLRLRKPLHMPVDASEKQRGVDDVLTYLKEKQPVCHGESQVKFVVVDALFDAEDFYYVQMHIQRSNGILSFKKDLPFNKQPKWHESDKTVTSAKKKDLKIPAYVAPLPDFPAFS